MALPTYPFWPDGVPWEADGSSYSEKPQGSKTSFQPDAGVPIERTRVYLALDDVSYTSRPMSSDQFEELVRFWRYTLKQGALPMLRYHPRRDDGHVIVAKFADAPGIASYRGPDLLSVWIKLLRIPSAYDNPL